MYQNEVLLPTLTLEEAVGVWPVDKNVVMRYRKRGETEMHTLRPPGADPLSRGLRRKAVVPAIDLKPPKDVKEKRGKEGCRVM